MPEQYPYTFAARDHAILRGIAVHRPQGQRGYYALLQHKLVHGTTVADGEVPPGIVTLDSLVRYTIGEGQPLEHRLVIGPAREELGRTVSLRSLYGLALIGAREGQVLVLGEFDGTPTKVSIEAVLHQPEGLAARRRQAMVPEAG